MPRKNLFEDYEDDGPKRSKAPEPKVISETKEYVEMLVTDSRTGAQYKVKEKKPHGPQGNFSIPNNQAENRYRMIMGLPAATPFHSERPDDPFAEDRVLPESMMSRKEVDEKVRERIMGDTRRQQFLMPSREGIREESEEIPDRPSHTFGYFGTEKDVHSLPAKLTREQSSRHESIGAFTGPQRNYVKDDPIEKRVGESRGLQVLLTAAYRGIFGTMVADHIMTRSSLSDKRPGFETPVVSTMIQDYGLMKPWKAPDSHSQHDRPSKPENMEYAAGLRAIQAIPKGPEAPDLEDLPKAEREAIITAIGRTVLHALTSVPQQIGAGPDVETTALSQRREEIKRAIAGALKPDLLRGIVPQEYIITDRSKKDASAVARVGGSSRVHVGPQRIASENLEEQRVRPVTTRPTLGDFNFAVSSVSRKKKVLFEDCLDDDREGGREGRSGSKERPNEEPQRPTMPDSRPSNRSAVKTIKNTAESLNDKTTEMGLIAL
jgi:hypothetical protein